MPGSKVQVYERSSENQRWNDSLPQVQSLREMLQVGPDAFDSARAMNGKPFVICFCCDVFDVSSVITERYHVLNDCCVNNFMEWKAVL